MIYEDYDMERALLLRGMHVTTASSATAETKASAVPLLSNNGVGGASFSDSELLVTNSRASRGTKVLLAVAAADSSSPTGNRNGVEHCNRDLRSMNPNGYSLK